MAKDYNQCPEQEDGIHGPVEAALDPEISEGFVSIACAACGLTTGIPIPPLAEIEWN